jgi:hypothetical protein
MGPGRPAFNVALRPRSCRRVGRTLGVQPHADRLVRVLAIRRPHPPGVSCPATAQALRRQTAPRRPGQRQARLTRAELREPPHVAGNSSRP